MRPKQSCLGCPDHYRGSRSLRAGQAGPPPPSRYPPVEVDQAKQADAKAAKHHAAIAERDRVVVAAESGIGSFPRVVEHVPEQEDENADRGRVEQRLNLGNGTAQAADWQAKEDGDRKSTRLNSSHVRISYAVFCLKK